jgi:two-component system, OmpR family, sensor kinase
MALVLVAAGLFVYLRLRADLDESVDEGLQSRADTVAASIEGSGRGTVLPGVSSPGDPDEGFAQVLAPDGRLLSATGGARQPALAPEEARQASRASLSRERRVPGVAATARLLARPARANGRPVVVVTGSTLEDRDETLSGVIASFAVGGPIAVLAASGLGYLLASAGLAPVEAMRRRAERISLSRAGERLPLPAAHDEVRRLGETLNEMLARLEASFERERRFVADASHELRTPLAVLKTELEAALRTGGLAPEAQESLAAAIEEVDGLAQLAEDLLLIVRAADGRLPVRPETVELRELLDQSRVRFLDRARRQDREIGVNAPPDLRGELDPLRLRQALGNLIDNALRHGRGEVGLAASRDGDALEVAVTDRGPGFPPELAARAFERFARGDEARTRGGAGLGLAIVRAIAEAHGGTVAIDDAEHGGATVVLRFPVARQHPENSSN